MKNLLFLFYFMLCLVSCDNSKTKEIIKKIAKDNKELKIELFKLKSISIVFKEFEKIVLDEINNSPDDILKSYKNFIKKYPSSYWSIEAKKRIFRIDSRKIFWNKEKGWDMPKLYDTGGALFIKIPPHIVSCPSAGY